MTGYHCCGKAQHQMIHIKSNNCRLWLFTQLIDSSLFTKKCADFFGLGAFAGASVLSSQKSSTLKSLAVISPPTWFHLGIYRSHNVALYRLQRSINAQTLFGCFYFSSSPHSFIDPFNVNSVPSLTPPHSLV